MDKMADIGLTKSDRCRYDLAGNDGASYPFGRLRACPERSQMDDILGDYLF